MSRPQARRRLAPGERRAEIIRAADRVLEGRDLASVTFEEIAAAAGVSRALVYNYFGDRGGLLGALYVEVFADLDAGLLIDRELGERQRVQRTVERYVRFARTRGGGWLSLSALASAQHPVVAQARERRYDRLAESWGGGAEVRVIVTGLFGLLEAVIVDWLARPRLTEARLTELLGRMAWSGFDGLIGEGFIGDGPRIVGSAVS